MPLFNPSRVSTPVYMQGSLSGVPRTTPPSIFSKQLTGLRPPRRRHELRGLSRAPSPQRRRCSAGPLLRRRLQRRRRTPHRHRRTRPPAAGRGQDRWRPVFTFHPRLRYSPRLSGPPRRTGRRANPAPLAHHLARMGSRVGHHRIPPRAQASPLRKPSSRFRSASSRRAASPSTPSHPASSQRRIAWSPALCAAWCSSSAHNSGRRRCQPCGFSLPPA